MSMKVHGLAGGPYKQDVRNDSSSGKGRKGLPSLDEISKRLAGNVTVSRAEPSGTAQSQSIPSVNRLPAFLKRASPEIKKELVLPPQLEEKQQFAPVPKDAGIGKPRMQAVGRLAFAPVPGVTKVAEVSQASSAHGPTSRPRVVSHTDDSVTTGNSHNNHNRTSKLKFPTLDGHAAAFRSRSERPSSLSSLHALTDHLTAENHLAGQRARTRLTAEALHQLARRTERGSAMVERLSRRVSAPGDMSNQQLQLQVQVQQRRNMRGGF